MKGKLNMFRKVKMLIIGVAASAALLSPALVPAIAQAQVSSNSIQSGLCQGTTGDLTSNNSGACAQTNQNAGGVNTLLATIINIFSLVVGAISVIMIIYGGLRYVISGGDSGNVTNARNT